MTADLSSGATAGSGVSRERERAAGFRINPPTGGASTAPDRTVTTSSVAADSATASANAVVG